MAPIVKVLSDITIDFTHSLSERKRQEGVMDFNDLEHYVLDVLVDKDDPAFTPETAADFPSEAALAIRSRYKEVMIDEYQDTNGVQELITSLLSSGDNRFMVGDIKQAFTASVRRTRRYSLESTMTSARMRLLQTTGSTSIRISEAMRPSFLPSISSSARS